MKQGHWSMIRLANPMAKVDAIKTTMIRLIGCANRLPPARRVLMIGPPAVIPAATGNKRKPSERNIPGR